MIDDEAAEAIGRAVQEQIRTQGVGCIRVDGGWELVFSRHFLEQALAKSIAEGDEEGLVMIHVSRGLEA